MIAWAVDDDVLERRCELRSGNVTSIGSVIGRLGTPHRHAGRPVRRHGAWPGCQDGCGDPLHAASPASRYPGDAGMEQLELAARARPYHGGLRESGVANGVQRHEPVVAEMQPFE